MSSNTSAIMYTDVVGYSKLTGDNQELALIILEEHNEILKKYTDEYSGNIVKLTGDGLCALFDKPLNAIKSAIDIQIALDRRNELNAKERQIQIRIGLHYGTYEHKDGDVFGDGINIAKNIEPIAPYGGIAISDTLNDLVWDEGDIYIREYKILQLAEDKIKIYEVFLDLVTWLKNKNKQKVQKLDSKKMYAKAHHLFHEGDYSSAVKFSELALETIDKNELEIQSFVCNGLISIGELDYAETLVKSLKSKCKDNLELQSHIYKMEGHLSLNNADFDSAKKMFVQSFELMQKLNSKYINELIYNICTVLLYDNSHEKISLFLEKIIDIENDQYSILVEGFKILFSDFIDDKVLISYTQKIQNLENDHLSSLAFRIITLIYMKIENYHQAQGSISQSQKLLKSSSKNISDFYQRKYFLENVYIHKDIMTLSDKISDHFVEMTYKEIKEENIEPDIIIESNFCINCGFKNKKKFKFCVSCGNEIQN